MKNEQGKIVLLSLELMDAVVPQTQDRKKCKSFLIIYFLIKNFIVFL